MSKKEEKILELRREVASNWSQYTPVCHDCGSTVDLSCNKGYYDGRGKVLCKACLEAHLDKIAALRYEKLKARGAI